MWEWAGIAMGVWALIGAAQTAAVRIRDRDAMLDSLKGEKIQFWENTLP
jgi:hypothetical protein